MRPMRCDRTKGQPTNMNDTTQDSDKFERRWNEHIGELKRLNWSLHPDDHAEERQRIEAMQEELREIVITANESDY